MKKKWTALLFKKQELCCREKETIQNEDSSYLRNEEDDLYLQSLENDYEEGVFSSPPSACATSTATASSMSNSSFQSPHSFLASPTSTSTRFPSSTHSPFASTTVFMSTSTAQVGTTNALPGVIQNPYSPMKKKSEPIKNPYSPMKQSSQIKNPYSYTSSASAPNASVHNRRVPSQNPFKKARYSSV